MKKQLSIILTIFMVLITLVSCNKSTIDNGDVSTTAITTVAATTIGKEIMAYPSVDDFDNKDLDSFIERWKTQQRSVEEVKYNWLALDGSPETSLLVPKSISKDYNFLEVIAGKVEYHDWHRGYTWYQYSFVNEKEDYYNGIVITVIKGNRNYDFFYKEELTYDDLEFFVKEFVMHEDCSCYPCTWDKNRRNVIAYEDNAICIELPANKEWYMLYNGQIISVCVMDKTIMNSPSELFDYVSFEEIPLE